MGKIFEEATKVIGWTAREQAILKSMYGTGRLKSMSEVGTEFNVSRTRIHQLFRKSISRLFRDDHAEK